MKKKSIPIIFALASVLFAVGCSSSADVTFSGAYWNTDPVGTGVVPVSEKLVYDVSSVSTAEFTTNEMKNSALQLVIDGNNSSYVTELTAEGGNYVYKTTLTVSGKYVYGDGEEYAFENDVTETETRFAGLNDNFAPIGSRRKANNVVPLSMSPQSENSFAKIGYTATIDYGKTADVTVIPDEGSEEYFHLTGETVKIKKYDKKSFIDDSIMIFAFRAMDFNGTFNFTFNTVDPMSEGLKSITCSNISANSTEPQTVTPITLPSFAEDGRLTNNKRFDAYGVAFRTNGDYGQTFRYVYYAVNPKDSDGRDTDNSTRHRAVKIYQPQLFQSGYLCFTLRSAETGNL